jgi:hypothetical protein
MIAWIGPCGSRNVNRKRLYNNSLRGHFALVYGAPFARESKKSLAIWRRLVIKALPKRLADGLRGQKLLFG